MLILAILPAYFYVEQNVYTYDKIGYRVIESHLNGYRKIFSKNLRHLPDHPYLNSVEEDVFYKNGEFRCLIQKNGTLTCDREKRLSEEELVTNKYHEVTNGFFVMDPTWYYINDANHIDGYEIKYGVYYGGYIRMQTDSFFADIYVMCNDPLNVECIKFVCESVTDYINKNTISITETEWFDHIDPESYY